MEPSDKPEIDNESTPGPSSRVSVSEQNQEGRIFETEKSKTFTSSALRFSKSLTSSPSVKRKFRKLSVEISPSIPLNDDSSELIEEKEKSALEQERSPNKSTSRPEEEPDISIVKTMTMEQMQEHVSRCLQLSTENKINTKNAFALKLIDCMTIITKSDDRSNFAAMACQLDAGAKIYSHRVDAVHQQVMKLVETCMFAEKKKKKINTGEEEESDDGDEDEGVIKKGKEKKKRVKKEVIASNDLISRKPKENDPREKFMRLEALPGDIINRAKYNPCDLSLTLDRHTPFWMNWLHYEPTKAEEGDTKISDIEIANNKLGPKLEMDRDLDLSWIPKLEPLLPTNDDDLKNETQDLQVDFDDLRDEPGNESNDIFNNDNSGEIGEGIEMVSIAKSKMTKDGSIVPSNIDVIKALFHKPGESDYHYLKMDNANYWAGPSYWKRPYGHNLAENKRKISRKKREPLELEYSNEVSDGPITPMVSATGVPSKRASTLSKRTLAKWNKKKVTYPLDIHFEPEIFDTLFHVNVVPGVVLSNQTNTLTDRPDNDLGEDVEEQHSFVGSNDDSRTEGVPQSNDQISDSGSPTEFRGFPSPSTGSSSFDENQGFRGFPSSPSGSSPFDLEHGFRGFGSPPSQEEKDECSNPMTSKSDGNRDGPSSGLCDVYEGENLVPMVKTVKVDPIRIVAKPNRVDMQSLKKTMLNIIQRAIEDRENQLRNEGLCSPRGSVAFRDVLTELFSSDELHHRTRDDLTVQMAFLCVLTLANENNLYLTKDEGEDFFISYKPQEEL